MLSRGCQSITSLSLPGRRQASTQRNEIPRKTLRLDCRRQIIDRLDKRKLWPSPVGFQVRDGSCLPPYVVVAENDFMLTTLQKATQLCHDPRNIETERIDGHNGFDIVEAQISHRQIGGVCGH